MAREGRKPHAHKRGSKGAAGGYGGYRKRKNWGYERVNPQETEHEREVRAKRVAEFLARGGVIQKLRAAEPEPR